jgi:hypothetical protein
MADRYWVGGDGTWNASLTTNWSTSSGGAGGASAPTSADNVIFDAASNIGTSAFTVTLSGTAASPSVCNDFTTGGAGGALDGVMNLRITSSATRWEVYGNLTFPATNFTYVAASNSRLSFKATTTGKTVTTNGVSFSSSRVFFDGVGGGWTLGSAMATGGSGNINVSAGTFDTGNFNVNTGNVILNGTSTRTVTLGSSIISSSNWDSATTTNLTFNAGTSQITSFSSQASFLGGGLTYYNYTNAPSLVGGVTMTGDNTFNNLSINSIPGNTVGTKTFSLGGNITVSGVLSLGTRGAVSPSSTIRRVRVVSNIVGTQRTITCNGTLNVIGLADVDFRDINAAGTFATPWTGTRIGNLLGNSNITFTPAADKYWNLATGGSLQSIAWALSSGGAVALNNFPLAQDKVIIEDTGLNTGATITLSTAFQIGELDISTRTNAMTLGGNTSFYKNITLSSAVTMTGTGACTMVGQGTTQILDVNTATFTPPITINSPSGTFQLAEATTCSGTVTLTQGTLDLNDFDLTCKTFSSSNSNTRSIDFGTGDINVTGNNTTVFSTANADGFSYIGTPTVNLTYSGSTGIRTINHGGTSGDTEANTLNYNITAGTDIISVSIGSSVKNLNFTGFSGTFTNNIRNIFGNLTISSGMTLSAGTYTTTFAATSGTQTITSAGKTFDFPININGVGGTFELQDALTLGASRTLTLTNGTLDLNDFDLTCRIFSSSNSNTRSIDFGTGDINVTGNNLTVFNTAIADGFSYIGTPTVNLTYSGSTGTRTINHGGTSGDTEANTPNYNITAGTDIIAVSANSSVKNLNFTGFSGNFTNTIRNIFGNLTISSGMTLSAGANTTTFAATSGTQTITSAGKTLDFPVTIDGVGGTFELQDALTLGATRTLTLNAGTIKFKDGTTNSAGTFVIQGSFGNQVVLNSTLNGNQYTLSQSTGTVVAQFATIKDSIGAGGATYVANFDTNINGGNNTNWLFILNVALIGQQATLTLNSVTISADANVNITGELLSANLNSVTITANADVNVTGQDLTIQENTPTVIGDANVSVTGQELTIQENAPTVIGDANVSVTGQELTIQENAPTVIGDANIDVTGIGFTANLGTAVLDANTLVDLTGQAMTMQEGTATADDASAEITGLSLSMSLGTVKNIMWSEVNTGSTTTYTNVNTGTTSGWVEVNTGTTSPWKEVA